MRHLRNYIAVALLAACITGSLGFACDKASALKNSRRVNSVLREVVPIFQANGLSTVRLQEAIVMSDRLIVALEAGTGGDAVSIVASLITAFNALVSEDVLKITDPRLKTLLLVSLAVANITLREIADALAEQAPVRVGAAGPSRDVLTIEAFRAQPKWRCRDSVSGQFRQMDYCKKNPATTQVETR